MYWARSVRAVRAESIEAGRAAWQADAAADVAAACATLFWMEGAENWRIAYGLKVVGLRRPATAGSREQSRASPGPCTM